MKQQGQHQHHRQSRPRITIAVQNVVPGADELEYVVRLAARLGARLEGLFIEDPYLLHVAALPYCQEIRATSFAVERLNQGRIVLEMQIASRRAERALTDCAKRQGLEPSFRVWRGTVDTGLLDATLESDVFVLARHDRGILPRVTRKPAARGIVVLASASDAGERAMLTGSQLARESAASLTLLVSEADETACQGLVEWIQRNTARFDLTTYRLLTRDRDPGAHALVCSPTDVLVIPRDHSLLRTSALSDLVSGPNNLVLLIR